MSLLTIIGLVCSAVALIAVVVVYSAIVISGRASRDEEESTGRYD